ncbi:MAG: 5-formyltetrahydrofolate cyclo-ligase [Myxococcota bacterium]
MEKHELRNQMNRLRRALSQGEIDRRSRDVASRIRALPEYGGARTLAYYAPQGGEIDLLPLAADDLAAGRAVCFPRVEAERRELRFRRVRDLGELSPSEYGIRAPLAEAAETPAESIDLYLVPGLAFDPEGRRVGRGAGYYDRALRGVRGFKVGVAHDFQVAERVADGDGDVAMDAVVTDARVLRRASAP